MRALISNGVVLCVRLQSGERVPEACHAAIRGGLRVLEVTLTTPGALRAILELSKIDGVLAGAGTVLSIEDLDAV